VPGAVMVMPAGIADMYGGHNKIKGLGLCLWPTEPLSRSFGGQISDPGASVL
jgi:hypothetical protein